jgi:hypothetical protein
MSDSEAGQKTRVYSHECERSIFDLLSVLDRELHKLAGQTGRRRPARSSSFAATPCPNVKVVLRTESESASRYTSVRRPRQSADERHRPVKFESSLTISPETPCRFLVSTHRYDIDECEKKQLAFANLICLSTNCSALNTN